MFLRLAAFGIGGITLAGAGLGIYFSKNWKNNTNNPPQNSGDSLGEKPLETNTQRTWQTIISSSEYKKAEKTGKIFNFVTYKDDEKVDDNANYFLIEMNQKNFSVLDSIEAMNIYINEKEILSLDVISTNDDDIISQELDLPLFCFTDENVNSIEDLNFNRLKKCEKNQQKKYIVVFLGNNSVGTQKDYLKNKAFSEWHAKKPEVKLEIFLTGKENGIPYTGKMLKIFHKDYQPTIAN